jgi:hypothetical protein
MITFASALSALATLQATLELSDAPTVSEETKAVVRSYNEDDCRSAASLRDWLETQRTELVADGTDVPRPQARAAPLIGTTIRLRFPRLKNVEAPVKVAPGV